MSSDISDSSRGASSCNKEPRIETFSYGPWTFTATKGHILNKEQEEIYHQKLNLPHLPDMVFAKNELSAGNDETGLKLSLVPLDALMKVNNKENLVHVSIAKDWMEARKDSPHNKIVHPYDWTYTPTDYRGTLSRREGGKVEISPTQERINYEKLQQKEKILFFDEVILFEDELDDNGCSLLTSKLRVMPSGFFLLLRFYLRIDNTLIRVIDTRFYHEFEKSYIVREYTERESKTSDLQVSPEIWKDPNAISNHLTLKKEVLEKIILP